MAEIVDFGLQQHKIKMDSRYFENVLSVVAGDTGRRIEVQLLDTNGMVQDTTGLNLRLNAEIAGKTTFTDATLVDATTGKYQLDLSNGMFLAPGNWQFQWQITDSAGKKLHSFAFTGNVGSNISEGGSQATNFYLNLEDLKAMQEDLVNGTFNSEALETNIAGKLGALEETYAPRLTEVTAQLAQTMTQTEFDSWVATLLDGGPSIFMETLSALQVAYPNGSSGVALVRETDPARIYVWNGSTWQDYGPYQGIELKDGTVTESKLASDVKNQLTNLSNSLENMVPNPEWKNELSGWFGNNMTLSAAGGVLTGTLTALSGSTGIYRYLAPAITTHKYYISGVIDKKVAGNVLLSYGGRNVYVPSTLINAEDKVSAIITPANASGLLAYYIDTISGYMVGDNITFRKPIVVNLTEAFGIGKEPTKDEMDKIVQLIPNQFWTGVLQNGSLFKAMYPLIQSKATIEYVNEKTSTTKDDATQKQGWAFNIDEGLRKWRLSLFNPLKNVLFIGDSVTEGWNATNRLTKSWAALVKAKLQEKYGDGGLGFYTTLKNVYTFNGTWGNESTYGPNGSSRYATGTANTITFTLEGDNYDIYVQGGSNRGPFTVQVDSETPKTFTPSTIDQAEKYNVTASSFGTHTVKITAPSTGYIYFLGASANKGTSGVRVQNTAKGGGVIADISYGRKIDIIKAIAPNLTVISMIINDFQHQTPIDTYKSRMETVILEAKKYGSVLIIGSNQMDKTNPVSQKAYEKVLIELCKQHNCAFISIYDRWVDYATANANGLMDDTAHPTDKGHADQSNGILRHLIEVW